MRVIRIELDSGVSFRKHPEYYQYNFPEITWKDLPGPREEFDRSPRDYEYFGVHNFDLLFTWFDEYTLKSLAKYKEIGIAEYDVPEQNCVVGEYQCMFNIIRANKLCWIPLSEVT